MKFLSLHKAVAKWDLETVGRMDLSRVAGAGTAGISENCSNKITDCQITDCQCQQRLGKEYRIGGRQIYPGLDKLM